VTAGREDRVLATVADGPQDLEALRCKLGPQRWVGRTARRLENGGDLESHGATWQLTAAQNWRKPK
jgi:hypothetical protein